MSIQRLKINYTELINNSIKSLFSFLQTEGFCHNVILYGRYSKLYCAEVNIRQTKYYGKSTKATLKKNSPFRETLSC